MSLYLQVQVGGATYLLDTAIVTEIRPLTEGPVLFHGEEIPVVDLRLLFGAKRSQPGCCVLVNSDPSLTVAFLADAADSLCEVQDAELRPLPPIGPLGPLIDAISVRAGADGPPLRLRGERVWEWCMQNGTLPH